MSVRNVLVVPDGRLKAVCEASATGMMPVAMLRALIADLFDTCDVHNGAGLAAPQIGAMVRVFVINAQGTRLAFVDPIVTEIGEQTQVADEGCLSIPGHVVPVRRATRIAVYERGKTLKFRGLAARAIQHELDHLNGILISDLDERDVERRRGHIEPA